MVSRKETAARIKEFFSFSKQEIVGLVAAIAVTSLIFSFNDWGDESFNLIVGLKNLFAVIIISSIAFFGRLSFQKIYALKEGYLAEFKVWWVGLIIALVLAFVSLGRIPLILIGGVVAAFMVRQRLGEFRYGHSMMNNAIIAFWGILGNLILAIIFAIFGYYFPNSYFFNKAVLFNIIMAFCALLPLPQLEGLTIFWGSRTLYYLSVGLTLLAAVLLLTKTKIGLILSIIIAIIVLIVISLTNSTKD